MEVWLLVCSRDVLLFLALVLPKCLVCNHTFAVHWQVQQPSSRPDARGSASSRDADRKQIASLWQQLQTHSDRLLSPAQAKQMQVPDIGPKPSFVGNR